MFGMNLSHSGTKMWPVPASLAVPPNSSSPKLSATPPICAARSGVAELTLALQRSPPHAHFSQDFRKLPVEQPVLFQDRLTEQGVAVHSLHGSLKAKQRKKQLLAWHDATTATGRVLLATGKFVGEGFDDPLLDTLFLASPVSWRGTIVQYVVRLTRESPGKRDLVVFDYLDAEIAVLRRMFDRRRIGYKTL